MIMGTNKWSFRQETIFDNYECTKKNLVVDATAGCLGKDTNILMYDGSLKKVQDIKIGDQVMGLDSTPRNVLQIHKGRSQLYKIKPTKGEEWICNDKHILTVWDEYINAQMKKSKCSKHKTALVDYPMDKILNRKLTPKGNVSYLFLQRAKIDFKYKDLDLDPYFVGLWFADGTKQVNKCQLSVNCDDLEILEYLENFHIQGENKLIVRKTKQKGNCWYIDYSTKETGKNSNPLWNKLSKLFKGNDIVVPQEYYINSFENRLAFLAGLLDGDGYLSTVRDTHGNLSSGYFEITTKYDHLKDVILYLCRSVGLAAYSKKVIRRIKSINFEGRYNLISISGDLSIIPTKLKRKQALPRRQIKNVLHTGFSIEKLEIDDWYGFSVDKDQRFVLGDFTITHNSGKTTTIVECCRRTPITKRSLFMAFNKSIAEELRSRLPERVEVNTFHAKGLKVLFYNFSFTMKLNENKCFALAKKILDLKELPYKQQMRYLFELQDIWNVIRMNLLVDYENDIMNICIGKEIEFRERMIEDIRLIDEEWMKRAKKINENKEFQMDFTDMLWLPYILVNDEDFPKYDVVVADEVQDMNVIQRELLLRYLKPRFGRFIAVGDPRQNIYAFQGSSVSNFRLLENLPNTITLPLDVSYRCAKRIVEEAKTVFSSGIECAPNAIEGLVRNGDVIEAKDGDFVLCRNNLPLIDAFIALLERGVKATIKGKDFGNALCAILDKIEKIEDLEALKEEKVNKLMEKGMSYQVAIQNPTYINLVEKCSILFQLYRIWNNLDSLETHIKQIYTEDIEGVVLSTIHKSKGLEANKVFFLNPNLIPNPHAITQDAYYSEMCLKFVAITRAKEELIYCYI